MLALHTFCISEIGVRASEKIFSKNSIYYFLVKIIIITFAAI